MTKLLSITWYKILPPKFGGQKGIALFNKHLAEHYPLVCLCSENNESNTANYKVRAELPVSKKQFLNPGCWRKIKQVAMEENVTHIILEHPYHGSAALKAARATNAKLIVHSHNIESERFRQLGKPWWKLLYYYERWIHRKADLSLFKTEKDLNRALIHFKLSPDKCALLPYGIDTDFKKYDQDDIKKLREKLGISHQDKILLFAGTLDYSPNAKAIEAIYNEIAPRLQNSNLPCRILICGRNREIAFQYLNKLSHPLVTYVGEVEDINLYFQAADVFINPVIAAGGVQTKNIDALSRNCPVVCFENNMDESVLALARPAIFMATEGNWELLLKQVHEAVNYTNGTPPAFFAELGWKRIVDGLADRLRTI